MQQRQTFFSITIILTLVCVQAVAALAGWSTLHRPGSHPGIPQGIMISGVPVGGLTVEEAERRLKEIYEVNPARLLVLRAGGREFKVSPEEIDAGFNYRKAAFKAAQPVRHGEGIKGAVEGMAYLTRSMDIPLTMSFDKEKAINLLHRIKEQVDVRPRNATVNWQESKRIINPQQPGITLEIEETLQEMYSLTAPVPTPIDLITAVRPAAVTAADLQPLEAVLAECETKLNPGDQNRNHNVSLALQAIDNKLVGPGEVLSFNNLVGLRSSENGFKAAPVISDNRIVDGIGGGVCQVSTTLYYAALLADLEIAERHAHTKTVGYAPPGLDATVADGQMDLQLRNNKKHPVLISGKLENNGAVVRLWGVPGDSKTDISIITELTTIDPKLVIRKENSIRANEQKVVREGHRGYIAEVYKVIKNGQEERRNLVSRDYYAPGDRIILMGVSDNNPTK